MSPSTPTSECASAAALAELHAIRSQDELDRELGARLSAVLDGRSFALCVAIEDGGGWQVRCTGGSSCPLLPYEPVTVDAWPVPECQRLPVRYKGQSVGELLVDAPVEPAQRATLEELLVHYGTALVNHCLAREARLAADNYCASLQVLEEGIVLFQEEDPSAVTARLLALASSMVQATAGALYVLEEVGNVRSGLRLEQALGVPETLLASMQQSAGVPWPQVLLDEPTGLMVREEDGSLAGLDGDCLPAVLERLVVLPLRYHGVRAGICLLFNPGLAGQQLGESVTRLQSFGQLAAAVLHRLGLEAARENIASIGRELQIAETIQRRLVPQKAPSGSEYDFAWRSIAAKSIGGDYLDFVTSDLGDLYLVVADASGHGINSALLMTSFRANYRGAAPWSEPEDLARIMNKEVVHEVGPTGMFITAALGRLERGSRRLTLASAGHTPTLLVRTATGEIEEIGSHGPPLGFATGVEFGSTTVDLASGDLLVLYTDGITEAADDQLDMYGDDRLRACLLRHAGRPAQEVLEAVLEDVATFSGRTSYDDDVSLLVCRVR
jgi:serine phosphatase RsbU (regulator of sigma subunit)